jgi:hypothetical protein
MCGKYKGLRLILKEAAVMEAVNPRMAAGFIAISLALIFI